MHYICKRIIKIYNGHEFKTNNIYFNKMSHRGSTEAFYREIITKVTEKMKDEYNNEGISEDTLLLMKNVIFIYNIVEMD